MWWLLVAFLTAINFGFWSLVTYSGYTEIPGSASSSGSADPLTTAQVVTIIAVVVVVLALPTVGVTAAAPRYFQALGLFNALSPLITGTGFYFRFRHASSSLDIWLGFSICGVLSILIGYIPTLLVRLQVRRRAEKLRRQQASLNDTLNLTQESVWPPPPSI